MTILSNIVRSVSAIAMFFFVVLASVQAADPRPEIYMGKGKWDYAVNGYDVVSYFSLEATDEPIAGTDEFVTEYKGVNWRFSTQENLDLFVADPDAYRPQYGGYCAYAVSKDQLARGIPQAWTVYEGKLYLNYSNGIRKKWSKKIPVYLEKSDANWPSILDN